MKIYNVNGSADTIRKTINFNFNIAIPYILCNAEDIEFLIIGQIYSKIQNQNKSKKRIFIKINNYSYKMVGGF